MVRKRADMRPLAGGAAAAPMESGRPSVEQGAETRRGRESLTCVGWVAAPGRRGGSLGSGADPSEDRGEG